MFTSLKALVWGENLASDPVGAFLGFALRQITHGSIVLDVAQLSQVNPYVVQQYGSWRWEFQSAWIAGVSITVINELLSTSDEIDCRAAMGPFPSFR